MPTEDEQQELDDGSAGGAIRWSPDNVGAPPASAAAPNAPVSWETLFGGSQSAAAPAQATAPSPAQDTGPSLAQDTGSSPTENPTPYRAISLANAPSVASASEWARPEESTISASSGPEPEAKPEPEPDPLFSRGPSHQPASRPEEAYNPFTTPDPAPSSAPAYRPETLPGPAPATTPLPPVAPPAPAPQPQPTQAPVQAATQPPQPPAQTAAPASHTQAPPQALGFNPAPQFSSSSDKNTAAGKDGQSNSQPQPVRQYFTADDIEEEVNRELGQTRPTQSAQPQDTNAGRQQQAPSPYAQGPASQGLHNNPTAAPSPYAQEPGPSSPQTQVPMNHSSGQSPTPSSTASYSANDQVQEGPDLSSVPEIETGRIWEQRSIKEILMGILKAKKAEYAVALLASTDGAIQGEMLIVKSVVIHGAKLVEPDLSGYEALKIMLTIPHGTYTLLDVTSYVEQARQLEQGLNVRITQLANALPNLPDSVEDLMGASNISRRRSMGQVDLEAEEVKEKPPKNQTSLRERLPGTKMLVLSGVAVLALIMMLVVLYMQR